MISAELISSVKVHEGYRSRAYQDTVGVWTIGYGTNLQELQVSEELAAHWLNAKLREAAVSAGGHPWYAALSWPRKDVIVEMIYNLGLPRFAKFGKMLKALAESNYDAAAREMLDSAWATQVGVRAERLAAQMRAGAYWK